MRFKEFLQEKYTALAHTTNNTFDKFDSDKSAEKKNLGIHFGPPSLNFGSHICEFKPGARSIIKQNIPHNAIRLEDNMNGTWQAEKVVSQLMDILDTDADEMEQLIYDSKGNDLPEVQAAKNVRNWLLKHGYDAIVYKNRAEGLTDKEGNRITADDFNGEYFQLYKRSDEEFFSVYNGHDCYIILNPND